MARRFRLSSRMAAGPGACSPLSYATKVLHFTQTISPVARAQSRPFSGTARWFPQAGGGKKITHLCRNIRRGSLHPMDRRRAQKLRRNKLHNSFHAPKATKHLEQRQREAR